MIGRVRVLLFVLFASWLRGGTARAELTLFPGYGKEFEVAADAATPDRITVKDHPIPQTNGALFSGTVTRVRETPNSLLITVREATITTGKDGVAQQPDDFPIELVSDDYQFDQGKAVLATMFTGSLEHLQPGIILAKEPVFATMAKADTITGNNFPKMPGTAMAIWKGQGGQGRHREVVLLNDATGLPMTMGTSYSFAKGKLHGFIHFQMGPHERFDFPGSIHFQAYHVQATGPNRLGLTFLGLGILGLFGYGWWRRKRWS